MHDTWAVGNTCRLSAFLCCATCRYSLQADVFSYGVALWECVERQRPWQGMDDMQLWAAWVSDPHRVSLPPITVEATAGRCWCCCCQRCKHSAAQARAQGVSAHWESFCFDFRACVEPCHAVNLPAWRSCRWCCPLLIVYNVLPAISHAGAGERSILAELQELISECTLVDPQARPSMEAVLDRIRHLQELYEALRLEGHADAQQAAG